MKRHQGNMGTGIQADQVDLHPAAVTRRAEGEDRQRVTARALPGGPLPRTPQITEKLEGLRGQVEQFRARAIDLHVKLVELESKGDDPDVRALRAAMMAHVVRIEAVVRALVEPPEPAQPPTRFPSGTFVKR
jgi:hypothetical protein